MMRKQDVGNMCFGGNAFIGEHETLGKSERVDREYLDEQIKALKDREFKCY